MTHQKYQFISLSLLLFFSFSQHFFFFSPLPLRRYSRSHFTFISNTCQQKHFVVDSHECLKSRRHTLVHEAQRVTFREQENKLKRSWKKIRPKSIFQSYADIPQQSSKKSGVQSIATASINHFLLKAAHKIPLCLYTKEKYFNYVSLGQRGTDNI